MEKNWKQKMKINTIVSALLFLIAVIVIWASDGYNQVEEMVIQSWWFWLLLPFAFRALGWFRNINRKAFNFGRNLGKKQPEE